MVSTTGNSSGSIAMASVMPARTPCSQSPRVSPYSTTAAAQSPMPISATLRTKRPISRCRRVCSTVMPWSALPIWPISVFSPVLSTRAMPWPCTTSVPEKMKGRSSPPGRVTARVPSQTVLRTGTDSPVSSDSSTARLLASSTTESAGTRSPSAITRMSPGTTSRPAMRVRRPSRTTRARGLLRSRRASSARSVFRSWYSVMPSTTKTKPSSMRASPTSPSSR